MFYVLIGFRAFRIILLMIHDVELLVGQLTQLYASCH